MNILITGGTGFIGSTLCSRLLEEGNNKIVILSRHSEKIKPPIQAITELNELKDNDAFDVVIAFPSRSLGTRQPTSSKKPF
jgi:NAD dependent epimerase/dehydratase family enzyme